MPDVFITSYVLEINHSHKLLMLVFVEDIILHVVQLDQSFFMKSSPVSNIVCGKKLVYN